VGRHRKEMQLLLVDMWEMQQEVHESVVRITRALEKIIVGEDGYLGDILTEYKIKNAA
jgi:hypothetical protein